MSAVYAAELVDDDRCVAPKPRRAGASNEEHRRVGARRRAVVARLARAANYVATRGVERDGLADEVASGQEALPAAVHRGCGDATVVHPDEHVGRGLPYDLYDPHVILKVDELRGADVLSPCAPRRLERLDAAERRRLDRAIDPLIGLDRRGTL